MALQIYHHALCLKISEFHFGASVEFRSLPLKSCVRSHGSILREWDPLRPWVFDSIVNHNQLVVKITNFLAVSVWILIGWNCDGFTGVQARMSHSQTHWHFMNLFLLLFDCWLSLIDSFDCSYIVCGLLTHTELRWWFVLHCFATHIRHIWRCCFVCLVQNSGSWFFGLRQIVVVALPHIFLGVRTKVGIVLFQMGLLLPLRSRLHLIDSVLLRDRGRWLYSVI